MNLTHQRYFLATEHDMVTPCMTSRTFERLVHDPAVERVIRELVATGTLPELSAQDFPRLAGLTIERDVQPNLTRFIVYRRQPRLHLLECVVLPSADSDQRDALRERLNQIHPGMPMSNLGDLLYPAVVSMEFHTDSDPELVSLASNFITAIAAAVLESVPAA